MKEKNDKTKKLILLCWLVYTCSYVGRLSYNSNINQITTYFNASYSRVGLVSTLFFFAYGIGQVINGLLCKKYNIKYVIFTSLIISSLMNILLINIKNFEMIKYLWLINGASMSFLWTSLIRLLSENIDKNDINKAIITMGTTVACGTFIVYGLSALFVSLNDFKITFYFAGCLLLIVSIIWLISYNSLTNKKEQEKENNYNKNINKKTSNIAYFVIILVFFAISNNFIKDGLTAWTPEILDSIYKTPSWLSILLTLLLPLLAVFGTALATFLHKKIKNFVYLCTLLFFVATILILIVVCYISKNSLIITIISFALVSCLMASVNNVITSMIPLSMKEKVNSGLLAGILNGFCYLGSTLSSYGLGFIAENYGWKNVFNVLLFFSVFTLTIGFIYMIFKFIKKSPNTLV